MVQNARMLTFPALTCLYHGPTVYVRVHGGVHSVGLDKCMMTYRIHHCRILPEEPHIPQSPVSSVCPTLPSTPDLFSVSIGLPFLECHMVGIMRCSLFIAFFHLKSISRLLRILFMA